MGREHSTASAVRATAVTTNVEFPRCIGLLVSDDVTATVTMLDGVATEMPLQKGYNPLQCSKVVFASGTIIALYN